MKHNVKALVAALLTALMLATAAVPAFAADAKAVPGTVTTQANAGFVNVTSEYIALNALRREPFVSQLNADNFTRTFYNTTPFDQLPVLMYNADLEKAAKVRAKEIVKLFSHTRPNGQRCFTAYPQMSALGENIACGQSSVTEVMIAFAEADKPYSGQGHRRNMLNPNFNAVGCACYKVGNYCYWVQCFGRV
ncbi:MAG: CAP domain-containing protein [Clostridia bacterium]|nr:CAP domain-containing protein [Clostridia bacterium]